MPRPASRPTTLPTVTDAQLNRATLQRQGLLTPMETDPVAAIEQVAGLQAQEPASPYIALWTRLRAFDPRSLDAALQQRLVVKASLMRVTVHLVSAADYRAFMPALLPFLRDFWRRARRDVRIDIDGMDRLADEVLRFAARPRTSSELRDLLARLAPEIPTEELWWRVHRHAPLIRTPGDAPWSFARIPTFAAASAWLPDGEEVTEPDPEAVAVATRRLAERYLAAFGPASVADLSQWSGLPVTRLRPAVEAIPDVVRYADERGRTLYDLPGAALPSGHEPVPPRLLPMWDSTLLAYDDRRRIISDEHRRVVIARNGDVLPTYLVDGHVAGLWWARLDGERTRIELQPFVPLARVDRLALEADGERLAALLEEREPEVYRRYQRHVRETVTS